MHLDPWSLLGLTTLVAAFLSSSKYGSYAWYGLVSGDIVMPDKEEYWQHALDFLTQPVQ